MKLKLSSLKKIITEAKLLTERSFPSVVITIEGSDGDNFILDPVYGRRLGENIGKWKYKDFYRFFKEYGVDFVNVKTPDKYKKVLPSGEYSYRKFLDLIKKLGI